MPANVESMFSVRQMPWHQEGIILGDYPGTWAEARVLAGLDWDPVTTNVYAAAGINLDGSVHYEPIDGWKSISRSDTGAVLSINKDSYTVIGHGEMGEIVEAVLAQPNVRWETAGVLDEGRAVWCLALLDEPVELPGDASPTLPYLAITNRHDGTAACALRATAVRIVCANTFRAAELEGERTGATFSFIHKSSWRSRIEDARQAVTGARTEMRRYTELAHELLAIPITPKQRELFVTEFIPMPPAGLVTDRVARNVEEARQALRLIFESKTTEHVAGTGYGLMQAAGEYLDHVRTARSWETRLNRTLIRPEPLKHRALSLIRRSSPPEITRGAPEPTPGHPAPTRHELKGRTTMDLISTSWSCDRCGAAFIGIPPEHGLCEDCLNVLEAQITAPTCPDCGGPVCVDCGQRLVQAVPVPWPLTMHQVKPQPAQSAEGVNGDGG